MACCLRLLPHQKKLQDEQVADKKNHFELVPDKKGLIWDLLLYVTTVVALLSIGIKLWFSPDQNWAYLLIFLASLFFFIGANRILKTRVMLLPSAAVALTIEPHRVVIRLKNGEEQVLVKDLKFYSEIGGKTFALTGMDLTGKKQQYIFHRGQFGDDSTYNAARALLEVYR